MIEYRERIIDHLDKQCPQLRSVDILDILEICEKYLETNRQAIGVKASKDYARLIDSYFQAKDQDRNELKQLEKQSRGATRAILNR